MPFQKSHTYLQLKDLIHKINISRFILHVETKYIKHSEKHVTKYDWISVFTSLVTVVLFCYQFQFVASMNNLT